VNSAKDAAICNHCGTPFIVERAIHTYTVQNTIHADTVIVGQSDFDIRAGVLMKYNGSATSVVVPEGVIEIGEAFARMQHLEQVHLPDGLKIIAEIAFMGCSSLKKITIPSSVIKISRNAFSNSGLTNIIIPGSVSVLEVGAFGFCNQLRSVSIEEGVKKIELLAFGQCESLTHVSIPVSVEDIESRAFALFRDLSAANENDCINSPAIVDVEMADTQWEKFYSLFPYAEQAKPYIKRVQQAEQQKQWYRNCLCLRCGGKTAIVTEQQGAKGFKFIQYNVCKDCGQKRDYDPFICLECGGKLSLINKCKKCGWNIDRPWKYISFEQEDTP